MFKHTLSLVASATLVASLEAQTLTLEPITITSNAIKTDELRATYAAEIYTSADIEDSHATTIYNFFATQSSLIVSPAYNNPFAQQIDIHGYGSGDTGYQNIVVTLNGRRLNNTDMTPQVLGSIPLSTIERIEILKGAGAVVYGDGANAAVINIITKQGNDNQITFMGGNYKTHSESLYLSSSKEKYSYSLHLDHYDTNGIRNIDSQGITDSQKSTNGGLSLSYNPSMSTEVYGNADFTRNNSFFGGTLTLDQYHADPTQQGTSDNGFGFNSSPIMNQIYTSQAVTIGLKETLSNKYTLNTSLSQEIKTNDFISTSYFGIYPSMSASIWPFQSENKYQQANISLNFNSDALSGIFGLQGTKGEVDWSRGTHAEKTNEAVFISGNYTTSNSLISLGGRFEQAMYQYSDSVTPTKKNNDSLYSYEIGYSYLFDSKASAFFHYTHAFQFPDLDRMMIADSTFPYTDPTVFNGFINPMKTNTYTLGYNHIDGISKFKASLYYVDLRDEIYYYSNDLSWIATVTSNTNIDKSHKYGLDLNYLHSLNDTWTVTLNYNYVKAIIDNEKIDGKDFSGNELPGVSNHSAQATVSYLPNTNTTLSLSQVYRSNAYAQQDFENNFNQKQEAYYSTNCAINYASKDYELFAKINNLFDQTNGIWIRDNQIYPADFKRTITAGVKFIF